jgi:hypothetical protein
LAPHLAHQHRQAIALALLLLQLTALLNSRQTAAAAAAVSAAHLDISTIVAAIAAVSLLLQLRHLLYNGLAKISKDGHPADHALLLLGCEAFSVDCTPANKATPHDRVDHARPLQRVFTCSTAAEHAKCRTALKARQSL